LKISENNFFFTFQNKQAFAVNDLLSDIRERRYSYQYVFGPFKDLFYPLMDFLTSQFSIPMVSLL